MLGPELSTINDYAKSFCHVVGHIYRVRCRLGRYEEDRLTEDDYHLVDIANTPEPRDASETIHVKVFPTSEGCKFMYRRVNNFYTFDKLRQNGTFLTKPFHFPKFISDNQQCIGLWRNPLSPCAKWKNFTEYHCADEFKKICYAAYVVYKFAPSSSSLDHGSDVLQYYGMSIIKTAVPYFKADKEFNRIVGASFSPPQDYYDNKFGTQYPDHPVDPELCGVFSQIWDENIHAEPKQLTQFSGVSIGDVIIDPDTVLFIGRRRKDVPIEIVVQNISENGFYPLVGMIPKPGSVVSDGKIRKIFPMHITYEAALRLYFRDAKDINMKQLPCAEGGHSYDIKTCDKKLLPYFLKILRSKNLSNLIPFILDHGGRYRLVDAFPSGIYGTNLVTSWFLKAFLVVNKIRASVWQGDSFLSPMDIEHDWLRRGPDCVINGFDTREDPPQFINQAKILLPRFKRHRLNGIKRYAVTSAYYRIILGCDMDPYPKVRFFYESTNYDRWTRRQLLKYLENFEEHEYKDFMYMEVFDVKYSTWDSCQYDDIKHFPNKTATKNYIS